MAGSTAPDPTRMSRDAQSGLLATRRRRSPSSHLSMVERGCNDTVTYARLLGLKIELVDSKSLPIARWNAEVA